MHDTAKVLNNELKTYTKPIAFISDFFFYYSIELELCKSAALASGGLLFY